MKNSVIDATASTLEGRMHVRESPTMAMVMERHKRQLDVSTMSNDVSCKNSRLMKDTDSSHLILSHYHQKQNERYSHIPQKTAKLTVVGKRGVGVKGQMEMRSVGGAKESFTMKDIS